jgi:hypothetical protein
MRDFCHGASVIGYFTAVVNGFLTARCKMLTAVNFTGMVDMAEILRRIDERIAALNTNDSAVSFDATGSKDTIRNWRRAVRNGRKAGANTQTLQSVGKVLGIDLAFEPAPPEDQKSEEHLRSALLAYGVDRSQLGRLVTIINTFVKPSAPPKQSQPDDRPPRASRRREEVPSR